MKKRLLIPFITICSLGVGFFAGKSLSPAPDTTDQSGIRESNALYKFTNPLLECENNGSFARQKYIPFERDTVTRLENEVIASNSGTEISIYFRNLNNGPWFGIGEDKKFLPASLMKVALLISYLKWWDEDRNILDTPITIASGSVFEQEIKPENSLIAGRTYTARELLYHLIVYSDNLAAKGLLETIPLEKQNRIFQDINIPIPDGKSPDYTLSVKEYASFFRMLYNASYLSRDASEGALNLLSQSSFRQGLVAGLPSDMIVAHKFGEREFQKDDGTEVNQLHDCGIVYHPSYPYLICVMSRTENGDLEKLANIIAQSSRIIFEEIDKRYPYKK